VDREKIMIVEDEMLIAQDIRNTLLRLGYNVIDPITSAEEMLNAIPVSKPDMVLMDIVLRGSMDGIEAAEVVRNRFDIPVIFLTTYSDEGIVQRASSKLPFGYLLKPYRSKELEIVLDITRERHRFEKELRKNNEHLKGEPDRHKKAEESLKELSFYDDLTGVYNRRGFNSLMQQHIEIAKRTGKSLIILMADVDELKHINDSYGHFEGDRALIYAARALRDTFRTSDIIARWGGDEFIVLMINADFDSIGQIGRRITERIDEYNHLNLYNYSLSISWGAMKFDPNGDMSIEEVTIQADQKMYQQKMKKKTVQ
jgi:diguanylate cyclase (GGDEF)-like protein